MKRVNRALVLLPVVALAVAACGSDDDGISVQGAWARASAAGQTAGAAYFEITAGEADTLVSVSVPASVAAHAELHEVVPADTVDDASDDHHSDSGHDDGHTDHDGMDADGGEAAMVMRELTDGLTLPAGETVTLAPGGYHVMLLDLAAPLTAGDEFELTLDFATADDLTVTVEVAESAP